MFTKVGLACCARWVQLADADFTDKLHHVPHFDDLLPWSLGVWGPIVRHLNHLTLPRSLKYITYILILTKMFKCLTWVHSWRNNQKNLNYRIIYRTTGLDASKISMSQVKNKKTEARGTVMDQRTLKRLENLNAMNSLWLNLTENNTGHWNKWENKNMWHLR